MHYYAQKSNNITSVILISLYTSKIVPSLEVFWASNRIVAVQ